MINTNYTSPIDKHSEDVASFHQKILERANQLLNSSQSRNSDQTSRRNFDEITSIVNQLSNFKFEHAQKVLALKRAQQENEALEMKTFLEFHFSILSKYNDEFVKITKIQQEILNSGIEQIREVLNEMQFNLFSNTDYQLIALKNKEPQAFELLQLCAYLNPVAISSILFALEDAQKPAENLTPLDVPLFKTLESYKLVCYDPIAKIYLVQEGLPKLLRSEHTAKKTACNYINQVGKFLKERLKQFDENDSSTWEIAEECFKHFEFLINMGHWDKIDLEIRIKIFKRLRGYVSLILMDYNKAQKFYNDSISAFESFYQNKENAEAIISLNYLGQVCTTFGDYNKAISYLEDSLAMGKKLYNKEYPELIVSLNNLAIIFIILANNDQAKDYSNKALEIGKRLYNDNDHPGIAKLLYVKGKVDFCIDPTYETKKIFEESFSMLKRIYGNRDHPDVAVCLRLLGTICILLDCCDKAKEYYETALSMFKRLYGDRDHKDIVSSFYYFGQLCLHLKDYKTAETYYESSLKMSKRIYGSKEHDVIADSLEGLGNMAYYLNHYDKAEKCFEDALAIRKKVYHGKDHPEIASSLFDLGATHYKLGNRTEAIKFYEAGLAMRKKLYGENDEVFKIEYRRLSAMTGKDKSLVLDTIFKIIQIITFQDDDD